MLFIYNLLRKNEKQVNFIITKINISKSVIHRSNHQVQRSNQQVDRSNQQTDHTVSKNTVHLEAETQIQKVFFCVYTLLLFINM